MCCQAVFAAPDEEAMGKSAGYPAAPKLGQVNQDPYMVDSFSAMDSLNPHCVLQERKAALGESIYSGSTGRKQPLFTEGDLAELLKPLSD